MSGWRVIDQTKSADPEFTTQYEEKTCTVTNFWGTIRVQVRPDMQDAEMVALMARLEEVLGEDAA